MIEEGHILMTEPILGFSFAAVEFLLSMLFMLEYIFYKHFKVTTVIKRKRV